MDMLVMIQKTKDLIMVLLDMPAMWVVGILKHHAVILRVLQE
jgi:hypothetical protein